MGFFDKIKNYFSAPAPHVRDEEREREFNEHHEEDRPRERHVVHKHHERRPRASFRFGGRHNGLDEHEMVHEGLGVWAWIEQRGMFFYGDIPGVSGIMHSNMDDSFEECLHNLQKNIDDSISASFSSFRQDVSYDEICYDHPNAEIVFLPIHRR